MDFVSGIESVLAERSSSLLLRLVRDLDEEAAVYKEWWRGRMIAGAILVDFREDDPRVPALRGLGLPAVAVGHPSLTGPFPAVWTDDASAVAEAVRCLAARGHRRIARVGGPADLGHGAIRGLAAPRPAEVPHPELLRGGHDGVLVQLSSAGTAVARNSVPAPETATSSPART